MHQKPVLFILFNFLRDGVKDAKLLYYNNKNINS